MDPEITEVDSIVLEHPVMLVAAEATVGQVGGVTIGILELEGVPLGSPPDSETMVTQIILTEGAIASMTAQLEKLLQLHKEVLDAS